MSDSPMTPEQESLIRKINREVSSHPLFAVEVLGAVTVALERFRAAAAGQVRGEQDVALLGTLSALNLFRRKSLSPELRRNLTPAYKLVLLLGSNASKLEKRLIELMES